MAFTPKNSAGTTAGTMSVSVVAAPGSATQRLVKTITLHNADSASITFTLQLVSSPNTWIIHKETLAAGASWKWTTPLVLDSTSESLEILLAAGVTTTEPDWTSHYADQS